LVFLAFLVRLNSLASQSLWRDEVDAVRFALAPLPDVLKTFAQPGFNGPLYFLMLRGWIGLAGQSEFAIRFPSLMFGVMSIALIYAVGARLFSRPIGWVAATLLAFSGYHAWYSQEAKMYTLITTLALAAIYCLRRGLEDGRARFWLGLVVCTSLAMYAHILAALLIPMEVVLCVLWWPPAADVRRRRLTPALISFALLIVPYLPLAAWQLPLVFKTGETGFGHYTLGEMLNVLNGAYTRGILNSLDDTWGAIIAGLAATLAFFGWLTRLTDRKRFTSALTLLIWLAVPTLAIWFVSLNRPLFTDRYLIWIMPAYYLSIALGLEAIGSAHAIRPIVQHARWLVAAIALVVLIGAGALSLNAQATTPYKSDFRSAAAVVANAIRPDDILVFQIPYIQTTFDYYYHQPYASIAGPYTNYPGSNAGYQDSEATVFAQLDQMFAGKTSVWLIASEVTLWDQRNLLQRWLDAHGAPTQQDVFAQVIVTRYELK
jgi:4-amino-4-deoxy-L-arabinose transferase-like glycosyltransferase